MGHVTAGCVASRGAQALGQQSLQPSLLKCLPDKHPLQHVMQLQEWIKQGPDYLTSL